MNREPDAETPSGAVENQPDVETLLQDCAAEPDQYAWEFANVSNEGSNETKQVCQGDFIIWNTSDEVLLFKWYQVWDNGAMQDIGWEELHQRLEPGDQLSQHFETQTWTDGSETMATFTDLIVFHASPECVDFLDDKNNEDHWDTIAVPLIDPCR